MSNKSSLLWEIKHPEKSRSSYLFGTMHIKGNEAFKHLSKALAAMDKCQAVSLEYNLDEALTMPPTNYFTLPDGQSLYGHYGPKKYRKLRKVLLKSFGVNLDHHQYLLPLMTINVITESLFNEDQSVSLDSHLWNEGINRGLQMGGVESFSRQLEILKEIPIKFQLKSLKDIGKNVKGFRKTIRNTSKLYMDQDIQQLFQMSKKSLGPTRKILLYDRNARMAEAIKIQSSNQNVFVAVGAAHLAGKKGVLRHLKLLGLKIKAL